MNIKDAIFTAASYLGANGAAEGDYEHAVFMYNHDPSYVEEVLGFAALYVSGGSGEDVPAVVIDGAAWQLPGACTLRRAWGCAGARCTKASILQLAGIQRGRPSSRLQTVKSSNRSYPAATAIWC